MFCELRQGYQYCGSCLFQRGTDGRPPPALLGVFLRRPPPTPPCRNDPLVIRIRVIFFTTPLVYMTLFNGSPRAPCADLSYLHPLLPRGSNRGTTNYCMWSSLYVPVVSKICNVVDGEQPGAMVACHRSSLGLAARRTNRRASVNAAPCQR